MSDCAFEIEIITQRWTGSTEEDAERTDLCSHGDIRLTIGDCVIAAGDGDDDYTISTSALALLRTLESDHSPEHPLADRLILHCGMLMMLSCPIGIDWSVSHFGARVRLYDVVRYDSVDETQAARFPGLAVEMGEDDYRRQVVAFAEKAKRLFEGVDKVFDDESDRQEYDEFWREFDVRLSRTLG